MERHFQREAFLGTARRLIPDETEIRQHPARREPQELLHVLADVKVEFRDPWDLAALRVAEASGTEVVLDGRRLHFACPDDDNTIGMGNIGTMGHGSGTGASQSYGGRRRNIRRSMNGAITFVGEIHLDASGDATVDVPLPAYPGRWRFEALAVAPDGGTATAHAIATAH